MNVCMYINIYSWTSQVHEKTYTHRIEKKIKIKNKNGKNS